MWKTLLPTTAVALTLALAAPAMAQNFDRWDADGDSRIDSGEFEQGFIRSGAYSQWDSNNDGMVDESEFSEGVFAAWDRDGDGVLERQEFERGMPNQ